MKFKSSPLKIAIAVLLVLLAAVGLWLCFPAVLSFAGYVIMLFLPFILGYLFSHLINPLATWLQKRLKLPRQISAILVIVLTIGIMGSIVGAIIWKIIVELRSLYDHFPAIYENAKDTWEQVSGRLSNVYAVLPEYVQAVLDKFGTEISQKFSEGLNIQYTPMVQKAGDFAKSLPNVFIAIIVFILSLYFMVTDAQRISRFINHLIPKKMIEGFERLKFEIKRYLGGYVKAQLIIMSIAFCVMFIGFTILKVDYALLIALGIAFLDALPFFGSGAALWPWSLVSFLMGNPRRGVGLIIIYLVVIFTRQMIEPKIVSNKIGMYPIFTLMAMYVGYKLFSIGGMILGPLTLMLIISFYRAGIFDGLIGFCKAVWLWIKKQCQELIAVFKTKE